jgi:sugar lactone lactonase YvrE
LVIPEVVAELWPHMPSGVTVAPDGRIFLCFPRWFDAVPFTVAELVDGKLVAYPSRDANRVALFDPTHHLLSVQSVVATDEHTLWLLDTGRPYFFPAIAGATKLIRVNLDTNAFERIYVIPPGIRKMGTYLNDVRFTRSNGVDVTAFITDSATLSTSALIVIDLATGRKLRRLENDRSVREDASVAPRIEGELLRLRFPFNISFPYGNGADGIALSPDQATLYYCPLTSRRLFSIDAVALADPARSAADLAALVCDLGEKGVSDGLECGADGTVYATDLEDMQILQRTPAGSWTTLVGDPRMLWTDTLSIARGGYLYFTCTQIHRAWPFWAGRDRRKEPYWLLRVPIL